MTRRSDPIPEDQLFRALLLRLLETHKVLTPLVQTTTSKALKICHMENAFILSEIQSWLEDQTEASAPSPSLSAAQTADMLAGLGLGLTATAIAAPTPADLPGASSRPLVSPAPSDSLRRSISQVQSSRPARSTPPAYPRNSLGQVVFQPPSSSAKPDSTSPIGLQSGTVLD